MIFEETTIKGAYLIKPEKRKDDRGFFARMFCKEEFDNLSLETNFVQGNMSRSVQKNILRGMHFQKKEAAETKLVRCTFGRIYDVILDIRRDSETFGHSFCVELNQVNAWQLYIPIGIAHGFLTLSEISEISYLVSSSYRPGMEGGIRWNDPYFNINWPNDNPKLSEKDERFPDFKP